MKAMKILTNKHSPSSEKERHSFSFIQAPENGRYWVNSTMNKLRQYVTILLMLISSIGYSQTKVTSYNTDLRSSPSIESRVSKMIPQGASVYVVNQLENGWSYVIYNHNYGYVRSNRIHDSYYYSRSSGSTPVKYYINSSGELVQSPTYYESAPKGATARCKDGTYSFSQNRRGTCSHHGGVAKWL